MSEAVTALSLMMMTLIVFEELLGTDRHTHTHSTHTHTVTHTVTHTHTHTHTLGGCSR